MVAPTVRRFWGAMEITPELLDQIAGCAGMRGDKKGQDRRKSRRVPVALRTKLMPLCGGALGKNVMVRLRDVSQTGVGLLQPIAAEPGVQYIIELPRRGERPVWASVVVVRVQPLSHVLFLVGARFESLLEGHPADCGFVAMPEATPNKKLSPEDVAKQLQLQESIEIERIRQRVLS
jgi:hypothetical protein